MRRVVAFVVLLFLLHSPLNLVLASVNSAAQPQQTPDTPTWTPTPTKTPTSTPMHSDFYEPNDSCAESSPISVGAYIPMLTFVPLTGSPPDEDKDYYRFWGKTGRIYQVGTAVDVGLDTKISVYGPGIDGPLITWNDDAAPGDLGSIVTFNSAADAFYCVEVVNLDPAALQDPIGKTYRLWVDEIPPTSTPLPTATGTPLPATNTPPPATSIPGADAFEPNYNFELSSIIAANVKYDNLNFVPWAGSDPNQPDNDFFRLWVKPGMNLVCETLNLAAGTDTNLILYFGPSFENQGPGNDDKAPGELGSRVTWFSTYTGWLYVLVGPRWGEAAVPP
ncbi:MAG: hypothetical protein ABFQ89_01140, partial [Chloroflexota bacterium]